MYPSGPTFKTVAVAGTNGKGSTVTMLAATLDAAGYKTGAYTSPHLLRYNERVCINSRAVNDESLCQAFQCVESHRGDTTLTYFEFGTLAALQLFHEAAVDIAVLEVGLGGRLDAVNIIDADLAIITSIGLDHVDWLGDNRQAIASEKAGIFRKNVPAICADRQPPENLSTIAKQIGARYYEIGTHYDWFAADNSWVWVSGESRRAALPYPSMRGGHQTDNAATVIMALELLDDFPVGQSHIRLGLSAHPLAGRFQVLPGTPMQILDVAHNAEAVAVMAGLLQQSSLPGDTHAVVAMLENKPHQQMFRLTAACMDHWYLAELDIERSASTRQLQQAMVDAGIQSEARSYPSVVDAYRAALSAASPNDRIVVFGSFHTVSDILALLQTDTH